MHVLIPHLSSIIFSVLIPIVCLEACQDFHVGNMHIEFNSSDQIQFNSFIL